jgi:4-diphosphocytidyl-2C-methyl-D-erythritol kinase
MLNLENAVTISKTINSSDGMGGFSSTTSTAILSLSALWVVNSQLKYISDKVAKDATHVLAVEYGTYAFNSVGATGETIIETASYNGATYKLTGFADDIMQLHEIVVQGLERIS